MELYRIMSFFELYELLINKHLKMTKLSLMEDLNEGFAYSLKSLLPDTFNPGFLSSNRLCEESYNLARESNFITCWTKEKESMAMWLLYSKDFKSIRVKTSKEKLKKVIDHFLDDLFYAKHYYSNSGTLMSNHIECEIGDVKYINFKDYRNKISKLKEKFDFELDNLKEKTVENHTKLVTKLFDESEKLISHKDILFLKNKAYQHENEVRAGIRLVFRNDMKKEDVDKRFEGAETMSDLSGTFIFRETKIDDFNNVYYIDLEIDDFIEEICFDPRMPSYQKDIYLNILGLEDDKRVVSSDIFGNYIEFLE